MPVDTKYVNSVLYMTQPSLLCSCVVFLKVRPVENTGTESTSYRENRYRKCVLVENRDTASTSCGEHGYRKYVLRENGYRKYIL